ncbi:hypothetical protein GYA49_05550 [Candidatus Beckwithbacteria bacterium]|nr:hypothetical protein [Candidatus Beckwithbacteria bacterium]
MKKIFLSLLTLSFVAIVGVVATSAYFSDTETSTGNSLTAGTIDLKVDNHSYYNGFSVDGGLELMESTTWELTNLTNQLFFDFHDLKPGDLGEDTISLHVADNPAWACMDITLTQNDENTANEPELTAGDSEDTEDLWDGELAQNLNMIFWADDGDNVLENNELDKILFEGSAYTLINNGKWTLADASHNLWDGSGPLQAGNQDYFIGKAWCFGTLTKAPVAVGQDPTVNPGVICDGTADLNLAQTDRVMADVVFNIFQARHNDSFVCPTCIEDSVYADQAFTLVQGLRKNGTPVLANRSNPASVEGALDGNFVSLGFGGQITVSFANPIVDDTANVSAGDISFHEVTNGRSSYPNETADIFVSQDGNSFVYIGTISNHDSSSGVSYVDISGSGFDWVKFVRIVDTSNPADFSQSDADGYDLDAVDAVQVNTCLESDR